MKLWHAKQFFFVINTNSLDNKGSLRIFKDFYCLVTMLSELGSSQTFWKCLILRKKHFDSVFCLIGNFICTCINITLLNKFPINYPPPKKKGKLNNSQLIEIECTLVDPYPTPNILIATFIFLVSRQKSRQRKQTSTSMSRPRGQAMTPGKLINPAQQGDGHLHPPRGKVIPRNPRLEPPQCSSTMVPKVLPWL